MTMDIADAVDSAFGKWTFSVVGHPAGGGREVERVVEFRSEETARAVHAEAVEAVKNATGSVFLFDTLWRLDNLSALIVHQPLCRRKPRGVWSTEAAAE